MIICTKELLEKYKDYKVPRMKIKSLIDSGKYHYINRGLYDDNSDVSPYLLSQYIVSPSYISFEYVLIRNGLMLGDSKTITCAITDKHHYLEYENEYGKYTYHDIPLIAFPYGFKTMAVDGYSCSIASTEKALCDYLYISKPLKSKKALINYLFYELYLDRVLFRSLNHKDIMFLCSLYKKKNLYYLSKLMEDYINEKYPL